MGTHRGWFVKVRDGRFQGHALDPKTGKYATKTFGSMESAETWAKEKHAKILLGLETTEKPTAEMATITTDFMDSLRLADSAPEHMTHVQRVAKMAMAAGVTDLLDPETIPKARRFLLGLKTRTGKPASQATKNSFLTVLRSIGNFALSEERIPKNPFSKVEKVRCAASIKEVFTIDELRLLTSPLQAAHPYYPMFAAMIYTGMRYGEAVNLRTSWLLWDAKRIAIQVDKRDRAQRGNEGFRTKSGRGRLIRMMDEFAAIIRPLADKAEDLVLPDYAKMPRKTRQDRFERYLKHCGITVGERTPHSCRHTWCCLMLASGENEMLVKQYAGHSEKEMTEHYAQQQEMYRVQVAKEGWARGELSLQAPPKAAPAKKPVPVGVALPAIPGPGSIAASG